MGGRGSGSWYRWDSKGCLEDQLRVDARFLKKYQMFDNGVHALTWRLGDGETICRASLIVKGDKMIIACKWQDPTTGMPGSMEKLIRISQTPCRFGGNRKWLICPRCSSRMAVLVLTPPTVGCRHCLDLAYFCQRENFSYRALRRRNKIASRLDRDEFFGEMLEKPKGMHWRTFDRLVDEHDAADSSSMLSMMAKLKL
ncbi:MAG: hypothetical protein CVU69_08155 [Deltaproteobacteria bacterium HGW-Deltaproteobacteria-4]|nr:MAG: hypothetical protein CVU69_08155 [Deltaproteobacteria bacterium HGW-Deltaproteobacteria-4]